MNAKMETVAVGLSQLKEAIGNLKLKVPELPKDLMADPKRHNEVIRAIAAGVGQIEESVPNALKYLGDAQAYVNGFADRTERKIAQREIAQDMDGARDYIADCLAQEEPFYRSAAAKAYLLYVFSQDYESQEEMRKELANLCDLGLLVEDKEGKILIGGYQRFRIGGIFELDREEQKEIEDKVANFSRTLTQLFYQERTEKAEVMKQEANITPDQLRQGVAGKCLLSVPAEAYTDSTGKERWRGGGKILVETRMVGAKQIPTIFPIAGVGAIEREVDTIEKMKVDLPWHTLKRDFPPGSTKKNFEQEVDVISRYRGLDQKDAEAFLKKRQVLWHLCKRAFRVLDSEKQFNQQKDELQKEATIKRPEDFFGINGSPRAEGIALIDFQGAFNQNGMPSVYNLFFLAERSKEAGQDTITIVKAPPHVEKLFSPFMAKKFAEGENFHGLPSVLGRIFRAVRGQVDLAHEIAKE